MPFKRKNGLTDTEVAVLTCLLEPRGFMRSKVERFNPLFVEKIKPDLEKFVQTLQEFDRCCRPSSSEPLISNKMPLEYVKKLLKAKGEESVIVRQKARDAFLPLKILLEPVIKDNPALKGDDYFNTPLEKLFLADYPSIVKAVGQRTLQI